MLNRDLLLRCKGVNVKIRCDLSADHWVSPFWGSPRGRCCQKCHCWSPSALVDEWRGSPVLPQSVQSCNLEHWTCFLKCSFPWNSCMSEALWRGWKETSISVILRLALINASSFLPFFFFLNQFFWEAHLIEKSNAVRGEPFQDLPEELKVTVLSGEVWERRVWWYQLPLVLSEPFQFLINPSWVCQACSCKSKQLWWKSSGPLKLNLWAEILFIGNFLMQKWGKNTHWNAHWSLNPVP